MVYKIASHKLIDETIYLYTTIPVSKSTSSCFGEEHTSFSLRSRYEGYHRVVPRFILQKMQKICYDNFLVGNKNFKPTQVKNTPQKSIKATFYCKHVHILIQMGSDLSFKIFSLINNAVLNSQLKKIFFQLKEMTNNLAMYQIFYLVFIG